MKDSSRNPGWLKYVLLVLAALAICFLVPLESFIGIPADKLERDARESQKVDSSWKVSQSVAKDMGALLFYDAVQENYIFSVYLNKRGISFGYFFSMGGSVTQIYDSVYLYHQDGYGTALLSMNRPRIASIELDNGREVTRFKTNAGEPFAVVLPENYGEITFRDESGASIPIPIECV